MRLLVFLACGIGTAFTAFEVAQQLSETSLFPSNALSSAVAAADDHLIIEEVSVEIPSVTSDPKTIAVAKHEVTFAEWQKCVEADACRYAPKRRKYVDDNHPVTGVSWLDVQQYIAWISKKNEQQYRLPLESEWRALAANVLDDEVEKLFDDPRLSWAADYANFGKRADRRTLPIGYFGTETSGVADIAGNVWEWTASCWRSPMAPDSGETSQNCGGVRVLAGVHMTYQSELIREVPTGGCSIGFPPANIGFRLMRDIVPTADTAEQRPPAARMRFG